MKSVYKYSAEAGLPAGLYLASMSALFLSTAYFGASSYLLIILGIGFPFFLGWLMGRVIQEEPSYYKVSSLWLFGIYTVIFGTLISSVTTGFYLTVISPGFLKEYVLKCVESLERSTASGVDYSATIDVINTAISRHMLPTGMEFVASMGWLTCFSGSILSLLLAVLMCRKRADATKKMFR